MPSQTDRLQGFRHHFLSSSWTRASSTLPTAAWVKICFLPKLFVSVLGPADLPTGRSRLALLALHVANSFQFDRFAAVVVALFLVDNFENTHLPHVFHFFFPSCDQQLRVNPHAVNSPFASGFCGAITFIRHWTCKMQCSSSGRNIRIHLTVDSTHYCYHK